jgi:hypothetical protein
MFDFDHFNFVTELRLEHGPAKAGQREQRRHLTRTSAAWFLCFVFMV